MNRISQLALTRHKDALDCKGVIYALYSPGDYRGYVGMTINSPLDRFEKHVQSARAGSTQLVHVWIRSRGFRNVFVFFFFFEIINTLIVTGGSIRTLWRRRG